MNFFYCFILLLIPLTTSAYPYSYSNHANDFLNQYLRQQSRNINEKLIVRQQLRFPISPIQQYQPQLQPVCLPRTWICGPGLPRCCPGLMCYDGNAKRGRHCVARG